MHINSFLYLEFKRSGSMIQIIETLGEHKLCNFLEPCRCLKVSSEGKMRNEFAEWHESRPLKKRCFGRLRSLLLN